LISDESAISSAITMQWKEAGMPASVPQLVVLAILALLPMSSRCREATLKEIFSDPIVRALMDADGVNPNELEAMLRRVTRRLRIARRGGEDVEADRGNSAE
jgi:hypothetical protein